MKYKSSAFTNLFKYAFPVFGIVSFALAIYFLSLESDESMKGFINAFIIMSVWSFGFMIQMLFRLKRIETKDEGVQILDRSNTFINYKDIRWVSKYDFSNMMFITIKYRDRVSGQDKKIAYMPPQKTEPFKDDKLTVYIKGMVCDFNPNYKKEDEPKMMKNLLYLGLLCLPFLIVSLYFLNDSFNFF